MEQTLTIADQRGLLNVFLQQANDEQVQEMFGFYDASLDRWVEEFEISGELLEELYRRRDAYLRGEMKAYPLEEVKARFAARKRLGA